MSFLVLLWIILLGTALLLYLIFPLYGKSDIPPDVDPTEARMQTLALEREQSYSALVDLDEDYETGKLSEADYQELRAALLQDTARIVSQLESAAETDVETEIERFKQQKSRQ
jgi:hypothetical protein